MSTTTLGLFLRHLALSEEVSRLGNASDRDLLAAYESERGQAAFTELMRRHGPMVLRTCRRVLGRGPDAEDAFQATFVLLARKARQLGREAAGPLSLGGWLHRVAYRTAVNVLTGATRRRVRERQASPMSHPDPITEATWNEVRPILDAELDALPDDARRLLILCYLQGKTHAEAAVELGLPLGSVAWRLEKARVLLAERLVRRGITVSASLLAVLLGELASGAGVPAVLLVHTLEAATTFTEQACGMVSDNVARLVKGGLAEMTKSSTHFGIWLTGWLSLVGAGLIACQALTAWPDKTPESGSPATPAAERPAQEVEKQVRTDRYGDPLPPGALARLGTVRWRNANNGRTSILFTRDGKGLITASRSPAYLWEIPTGKLLRQFGDLSRQPFEVAALSPDGRILAGGGKGLRLWDLATGKLLVEGKGERDEVIECLAFSPDGKKIASAGTTSPLRLWDAATGRPQWVESSAVKGRISALAFDRESKTLAAFDEHGLSLVDAATGKGESRRWNMKRDYPLHAAFAPDGRTLAVAFPPIIRPKKLDGIVCLVDVATLKEVRQLAPEKEGGGGDAFQSLAIAPSGKVLATTNGRGAVRLWDTDTGKELRRCQGGRIIASALAFSADGKMLAGLDGGVVRMWETASGKEVSLSGGEGHRKGVSAVAFTSDGRTLISRGWDGFVRLWDSATGEQRQHIAPPSGDFPEHGLAGIDSALAPDGKTITVVDVAWPVEARSFGVLVRLWDREAGRERSRFFRKLGAQLGNWGILSPDGKTVACVSSDAPGVQLWEAATGKLTSRIPSGGSPTFSPDGKLLATIHGGLKEQAFVTIWATAPAKELCSIRVPEERDERDVGEQHPQVHRLAFSPDGKMLATVSDAKNTIHLWPLLKDESAKSGLGLRVGPPRVLSQGLPFWIETLAFSPDGRTLALWISNDVGTVRLLETATGKERLRFTGHGGRVGALSFSPDGRRLASGSEDTTILIWDTTGRLQDGRLRPAQLSAKELEARWADLAADDAGRAGRALWTLAADPAQTVPFLAKRLRRASARVAPETVAKLIRDLDDDRFAVRVKARKELEKLSAAAEPALVQALRKAPSLEVRKQLEGLLALVAAQRKRPSGDVLRTLRAVEALEQIGSRDARQLLKGLAAGAPGSALTQEAGAALEHLERAERR
jgi:RNA polymerase sigma factor (sigma-70 family)